MNSLREKLITEINSLIQNDFEKLVQLLYQVDINEKKLKQLLHDNKDKDAAVIITDLIIERQEQKEKSRQQFSKRDNNIDDNEKW